MKASSKSKQRGSYSSNSSADDSIDDDMLAATALSFGGIAESKVVIPKNRIQNTVPSQQRPKSSTNPPAPPVASKRTAAKVVKLKKSEQKKGPPPPSKYSDIMHRNRSSNSGKQRQPTTTIEQPTNNANEIMTEHDGIQHDAMGYINGGKKKSLIGNAMQAKILGSLSDAELIPPTGEQHKVVERNGTVPPPPPASNLAKRWMPISNRRSEEDGQEEDSGNDDSNKNHDDYMMNDIMGYVGSKPQSDLVNTSSNDEHENLANLRSSMGSQKSWSNLNSLDKKPSLKKAYSTSFQSDFSKMLDHRDNDEESTRTDDPSTVKSDGGSRRRRKGRRRGATRSSSFKKKNPDMSPAVEKLKLAQAKLESNDDNDPRAQFQKKDFINLLESSIRDLQAMQQHADDNDNDDDDESFQYNTPRSSEKSKSSSRHRSHSRRHRSRGRSTGHESRGSHDNKSTGHRSRGNKSEGHRSRGSKDSRRRRRKKSSGGSGPQPRGWDSAATPTTASSSRGVSSHAAAALAPVPREARKVLSCARGSVALPRETVVSSVVRRLVSKIDREDVAAASAEGEDTCCVAILSSDRDGRDDNGGGGGGGEGKSTIAALACVRGDVRTRYHQGIAWLNLERKPLTFNFESYSKALSDICRQIGVKPQQLRLSPVVRTPDEDETVSDLRMKGHMKEAHIRMGKLLTSLQHKRSSRRGDYEEGQQHTSVLIILDDVAEPSDLEWFQFRRGGGGGGENGGSDKGEQMNDLLVTSRLTDIEGAISLTVPPLEMKEAVRLLLTESDLPSNHPMANNRTARGLVKNCFLHPLTIKFAGRWLSLKRVTSGGQKGMDEILGEVNDAIIERGGGAENNTESNVDELYSLLNRAMSPLVKGKETKIVRLCFAALVAVFFKETCSASVPLEIANDFFLKVVENEKDILSRDDTFFQSNGRQASKLVPEILGALGIFNITKHTTQVEGSEKNESSIQIDHDLIRQFSRRIRNDENMHHLVKNAEKRWNAAYVQSYFQQKAKYLWDDIQPDRSRKYALEKMPTHMIQAEMFDDVEMLMRNESFIRGRFWSLGWTEGTRAHVVDAEAFCHRLQSYSLANDIEDCSSPKLVDACKQLEAVLMEEVARESGGPNGHCSTLEAGRCLHEISVSLARLKLWDEASRFCDSCVELVESNLGPSELVASLLYNSSVMHTEANEFDQAEKIIGDCLDMRVKTCGTESILYVRALCQLGDILSVSSDYSAAESCFNKSIGILKVMPAHYHLDFGITLYKLGRNQHRRGGYLDEALHCYEEALEFEKEELGPQHIFMSSIHLHMGDILFDKEDTQQAKHTFKEALDVLSEADAQYDTSSSSKLKIMSAVVEGKLLSIVGQTEKCINKYQHALTLLQKYAPTKKRKIAQICSMIGAEHEKKGNYHAAEKFYEESVTTMKSVFGPYHLDIAETLVNLSGVKSALGEEKHHAQATDCLEESIDIQKTRLGDCEECVSQYESCYPSSYIANCEKASQLLLHERNNVQAITLTMFGAHLKTIGEYKKAELAYDDAVRILQALEGDQDLSLVDVYLGIAELMAAMSKYDDAMEYYFQCLEIQESVFGEKHDDIASTLYAMGLVKHDAGLYSQALVLFAKSLVVRVELHGEAHPAVGDAYDMMGFVEAKNGDLDTALRRLNDGLKVRKSLGDQLKEADTLINIGNLHRERNEFELALQRYDDCLNIRISEMGRNNQSVADVLMALGNVQSDMDNPQDALSHYREALQILISVKGPNDASVALTFQKVGMVQFRAGNLESGRLFLEKAVELYRQGGKGYESELITPLFIIGNIHNTLQQAEEAQRVWKDAFEMSNKIGEKTNPEVHHVLTQLLHVH